MSIQELGEFLRQLAPLGVGGVLAVVIFVFYRRDLMNGINEAIRNSESTKTERDAFLAAMLANTEALRAVADAVRENRHILDNMREFCKYQGGRA